jgi:hypothetical protein
MPKTRNRQQRRAEKTDARQQRVAEEGRERQRKRASLSKTYALSQEGKSEDCQVLLTAHLLQRVSEDEVGAHFAHHNVSQGPQEIGERPL